MSNILIGITGGIAAYKVTYLIREFVKNSHNVKVIMTKHAQEFIGKATIETLSNNKVYTKLFDEKVDTMHIALSDWADIMITAPATANIIGKYANGIADDLLSTVFLSFNKKHLLVPAMNNKMYDNPIVQDNMKKLKKYGIEILQPEVGFLACGTEGKGRFPDYNLIYEKALSMLYEDNRLKNKNIIITAGSLFEKIDPVRVISNLSSGKMGVSFAKASYLMKAKNILFVHGKMDTQLPVFSENIYTSNAKEMLKVLKKHIDNYDILIMSAAVNDFVPIYKNKKIKKTSNKIKIEMEKNIDILKSLKKYKKIIKIGFALETNNMKNNALKKLKEKNLDFIILNSPDNLSSDNGSVEVISKNGKTKKIKNKNKEDIAIEALKWMI